MASAAAADDGSNHHEDGGGGGGTTATVWDRVVWFRRPDTEQWWPAERYPSHRSLLEKGFHFRGMLPFEQSLRLTRTYVHRECLGLGAGDGAGGANNHRLRRPVPVARLIGVHPPAFWAIEHPEQQLGEGDFLTFLTRHIYTSEIPRHLEGAVEEATRIILTNQAEPSSCAAPAAPDLSPSKNSNTNRDNNNNSNRDGSNTTRSTAAADTHKENGENSTVASQSAAAASTNNHRKPAPVRQQLQEPPHQTSQPATAAPAATSSTVHPDRNDATTTTGSSSKNNNNNNNENPTKLHYPTENDDDDDAMDVDDNQKLSASAAPPQPRRQEDAADDDFVVGHNDPIDPVGGGLFDNDDDDDDDDDLNDEETPIEILNNDSWETVLAKCRDAGWVERCGLYPSDPLRVVYYKIGTGGTGKGCREGVDYFTTEQFQAKLCRDYGWDGGRPNRRVTMSTVRGASNKKTPPKQRTRPQDPGKPLLEEDADEEYEDDDDDDDDDVQSLASSHVDDTNEDPIRAVAVGGQSGRKRRKLSKKMPRKQILASGRKSRRNVAAAAAAVPKPAKSIQQAKKNNSKNKKSAAWWQDEYVPSFQSVWPILFKIGFSKHSGSDGKFLLPKDTPGLQGLVAPKFSNAGLRKFLCKYGIPCYNKTARLLSEKEQEQLRRWIVFANVPVQSNNSVEILSEVDPYTKDNDIIADLISFGFETASGVYFPNYKEIRQKDKPGWDMGEGILGVHYLPHNELWTSVRVYIRGAWTFEPPIGRDGTDYDSLVTPTEGMNEFELEKFLRLHFFGATATAPLPEFTEKSLTISERRAGVIVTREELLKPLQAIPTEDEAKRGVKRKKSIAVVVPNDHNSNVKPTARATKSMVTETKSNRKKAQRQLKTDPHWWKHEPVPSFRQTWPILEKLGFSKNDADKFLLPEDAPLGNLKPPVFESRSGLRKFLCAFGIPCYDATRSRLGETEVELLRRWVTFANVPVHNGNSIERLAGISYPKKFDDILKILYKFGFSTRDGLLFFPKYTDIGDSYTARYHPMHGVHYLDKSEDVDLLRVYVRHAWRFNLLIDHDERAEEDSVKFETPTKYMNTNLQKIHLEVRLWAAVSSMPLPKFAADALPILTKKCDGIFVEAEKRVGPFERMPDIEEQCNDDEEEEDASSSSDNASSSADDSSVASSPSEEDCAPGSPVSANEKSVEPSDDESVHSVASQDSSIASIDTHYFGDKEWFKKCPGPDFRTEVWSILQKFGFTYCSGKYGHPLASKAIGLSQDVQKFCAGRGIPNINSVECTEQEKEILHRWASFAFVDVKPSNSVTVLSKVEDLSSKPNRRQELLEKLGFKFFDGKIYPPGSDHLVRAGTGTRKHKVHYYIGDEIRDFIRARETFSLVEEESRPGRRQATVSTEEMLGIRLWAALSPSPLPTFEQQLEDAQTRQKQSESNKTRAGGSNENAVAAIENGPESQPFRGSDRKLAEEEESSERHQKTAMADVQVTDKSFATESAPKQSEQQREATEMEKAIAQEELSLDKFESEDTLETREMEVDEGSTMVLVQADRSRADSELSNKSTSTADDVPTGKEESATTDTGINDPMQLFETDHGEVADPGSSKLLMQSNQTQADSANEKNGEATTEAETADPMGDPKTPVSAGKFETPATHGSSDSEFYDAKQSAAAGDHSNAKETYFPTTFLDQNAANNGDNSFLLTRAEDLYDSEGEEKVGDLDERDVASLAASEYKQMTQRKTQHVESVLLLKACEKEGIDAGFNKGMPLRRSDAAVNGKSSKEEVSVAMDCESESNADKKPAAVDHSLAAGPKENNDNNTDTELAGSWSAISSVDRPRSFSRAAHPGRPASPSGSVSSMVSRGPLNPSVLATLDETILPKSVGGSKRKRAAVDAEREPGSKKQGIALDSLQQLSKESADAGNAIKNKDDNGSDKIFADDDEDMQSAASFIEVDDDDEDYYDHDAPLSQWDE